MEPFQIILLGIFLGIMNTCQLHLAKSMERHGIEIFDRDKTLKEKGKKPQIYIVGLALNNTLFIYQFSAVLFVSASVVSSVFGVGLIVVILYAHFILKEEILKVELIGAVFIMVGTVMVGIIYIMNPVSPVKANISRFFILLIALSIIFVIITIISSKKKIGIAFVFGSISGIYAAFDLVAKRIALKAGISSLINGILTLDIFAIIFLLSFITGTSAFLYTQVGFSKGADASKLVPMFDSMYVVLPIIMELYIYEDAYISPPLIVAIIIIVIGIFLMNIFKPADQLMAHKIE